MLSACDIEIESTTVDHFLCFCPFHGNSDTPAMAVNSGSGKWICFNPSCDEYGDLVDLPRRIKKMNIFETARLILKSAREETVPFSERIKSMLEKPVEFAPWPQDVLDHMKAAFPGSPAETYMKSRGFTDDTLDYFDIGYSEKRDMVAVPMHDPKGLPIGIIGRSLSEKRFQNSKNLPKSKTMWNFHRAKAQGDTLCVTEASFDSGRVHQAGYPCTGALLGGTLSHWHIDQINKHFSRIIILTDFETKLLYRPNCRPCARLAWSPTDVPCQGHRPGRDLGRQIVRAFPHKDVLWGAHDDDVVYPHEAKDMSDLTDAEIRQTVRGAVSNLVYEQWNPEHIRVA